MPVEVTWASDFATGRRLFFGATGSDWNATRGICVRLLKLRLGRRVQFTRGTRSCGRSRRGFPVVGQTVEPWLVAHLLLFAAKSLAFFSRAGSPKQLYTRNARNARLQALSIAMNTLSCHRPDDFEVEVRRWLVRAALLHWSSLFILAWKRPRHNLTGHFCNRGSSVVRGDQRTRISQLPTYNGNLRLVFRRLIRFNRLWPDWCGFHDVLSRFHSLTGLDR